MIPIAVLDDHDRCVPGGHGISITDVNGNPAQIVSGTKLVTNIDSLNVADLQQLGFVLPANYSTTAASSGLGTILLYLLPILFIVLLFFLLFVPAEEPKIRFLISAEAGPGCLSAKGPPVTFADVADSEEAKEDLKEVVEFLKKPGNSRPSEPQSPKACCWSVLRGPARPCWPGR